MKNKILFFLVTTVVLGSLTYLIIRNTDKKNNEVEEPGEEVTVSDAILEDINYEKYLELRSKAHDTETYAIYLYKPKDDISKEFLSEIKIAFQNRKSVVYMFDISGLTESEFSNVIDDVTSIMKYKKPTLITPTLLVMSKGSVVFSRAGLMYHEELMENLNSKSIE